MSSPGQARVVVSILTWNDWQHTLECLESVRRLDYPNYLTDACFTLLLTSAFLLGAWHYVLDVEERWQIRRCLGPTR